MTPTPIEVLPLVINRIRDNIIIFDGMLGALSKNEVYKTRKEAILHYKQEIINDHSISITEIDGILREIK